MYLLYYYFLYYKTDGTELQGYSFSGGYSKAVWYRKISYETHHQAGNGINHTSCAG